jgi:hypothetical protein
MFGWVASGGGMNLDKYHNLALYLLRIAEMQKTRAGTIVL